MIYVFDTNSLSELNAYYPDIFKALWARLDALVVAQEVISTREVRTELEASGLAHVLKWATPVADPFVIACARVNSGTVVSQEKFKPNAAKIPNVCAHFAIPCMDLEGFMRAQNWSF